jgi:hypothetical protein
MRRKLDHVGLHFPAVAIKTGRKSELIIAKTLCRQLTVRKEDVERHEHHNKLEGRHDEGSFPPVASARFMFRIQTTMIFSMNQTA